MKVECINNRKDSSLEELILGKVYVVYALSELKGEIFYCICDELYSQPMWYPFELFKILDPRISRFWIFGLEKYFKDAPFFGIPEWVKDDYFYTNLVEGEDKERAIFANYQKLMDLEFPSSLVQETAQIADNEWLICPKCIDAWEYTDTSFAPCHNWFCK